jgi:cytochrome c oxidase subunit 2
MIRSYPSHLLPLLVLAVIPACAERRNNRDAPEVVVKVDPALTTPARTEAVDAIPAPRPIPPAAEPTDSKDALEIFCVASANGTWKFQYPNGQRATNDLRLPVGKPVRFTLIAEEGTGSFGVGPHQFEILAFPLIIDVWAKMYTSGAVVPKRTGVFGLRGDGKRVGTVTVMEAAAFAQLLERELYPYTNMGKRSMVQDGRILFLKLQCVECHTGKPTARAPFLAGLFGTKVALEDGKAVVADENYFRESILKPKAKVVEGWEAIMPSYDDRVSEEDLANLVAYIKSLKLQDARPNGAPTEPGGKMKETASPQREKGP